MSELCKLLQPCSSLSVVLYTPCHYISSRFHFLTRLNFLIMHELSRHFIGQSSSSFRNVLSYQLFSLDEFKTTPPQKNKTKHTHICLCHTVCFMPPKWLWTIAVWAWDLWGCPVLYNDWMLVADVLGPMDQACLALTILQSVFHRSPSILLQWSFGYIMQ